jgi:hypothetical protein
MRALDAALTEHSRKATNQKTESILHENRDKHDKGR